MTKHIVPYTYFVYNKITNHFYIGSRKLNVAAGRTPDEDLWKHYFTSSKRIESLIAECGSDTFVAEVVFTNAVEDHPDLFFWMEQQYIKENFDNPLCLNRHYFDPITRAHIMRTKTDKVIAVSDEEYELSNRNGWERIWDTKAFVCKKGEHRSPIEVIAEALELSVKDAIILNAYDTAADRKALDCIKSSKLAPWPYVQVKQTKKLPNTVTVIKKRKIIKD